MTDDLRAPRPSQFSLLTPTYSLRQCLRTYVSPVSAKPPPCLVESLQSHFDYFQEHQTNRQNAHPASSIMRTMEQQQQGRHNKRKMIRGVAVLILCVISIFSVDNFLQSAESDDRPIGRRFLLVESLITMSPWAYRNLVDINESPNASDETAMFW